MSQSDLVSYLFQFALLLGAALAAGALATRLGLPAVLGELAAGILIGPTVFGALAPDLFARVIPAAGPVAVGRDAVLKLGLLFFLFVAGLHVDLRQLRRRGRGVVATSLLGILVPFVLGAAGVWLLPGLWGPQARANSLFLPLFMATALSISALPVIARILMDLDLLREELGSVVMAAATVDDLIGWLLFAVLLSTFAPGRGGALAPGLTLVLVAGLAALLLVAGHFAGRRVLAWAQLVLPGPAGFIGVTAVGILAAGAAAEGLGVHAFLGAFLVGVALAEHTGEVQAARRLLEQFTVGFFAPLYFVSLGLQANFAAGFDLPLVGYVLVLACAGKLSGAWLGARLGGMPPRLALAVGFGLNARGAMGLILAALALEYRLIDQRIFVALIIMALVTSALSGPVMRRLLPRSSDLLGAVNAAAEPGALAVVR